MNRGINGLAGVAVGQIYGSIHRGKGKPAVRLRVLTVGADQCLYEIVGTLDGSMPRGVANIGVGARGHVPFRLLGTQDYPLLEDV